MQLVYVNESLTGCAVSFHRCKVTSRFFTRSCSSCRHFRARLSSQSSVFILELWEKLVFARRWRH